MGLASRPAGKIGHHPRLVQALASTLATLFYGHDQKGLTMVVEAALRQPEAVGAFG
jgi:hypothetical protein